MATINTRISDLATAVGQEIKKLSGNTGNLTNLTTTDKTSLVNAINELKNSVTQVTNTVNNMSGIVTGPGTGVTTGSPTGTTPNAPTGTTHGGTTVVTNINGMTLIDDAHVRTTTTYSSDKITKLVADSVAASETKIKNDLINGAPAALDTLKELADAVGSNKKLVDTLNSAIANKLSINNITNLTNEQRTNILTSLGIEDTDYVAVFRAALQ